MVHESFEFILVLLSRLERISADSRWAHQASGIRGALFRLLSHLENGNPVDLGCLDCLVDKGYEILEKSLND